MTVVFFFFLVELKYTHDKEGAHKHKREGNRDPPHTDRQPTMSSGSIQWPAKLLQTAIDHLKWVEDPHAPSMPPLQQRIDIFTFFQQYTPLIKADLAKQSDMLDNETVDCCTCFLIDLLEHSCGHTFLFPKERRLISAAAALKERQWLTSSGGMKRRRSEASSSDGIVKYARVLSLEYFLRLVAALPRVLADYNRVNGNSLPSYCTKSLYTFINCTLLVLDGHPEFFSARQLYVLLR